MKKLENTDNLKELNQVLSTYQQLRLEYKRVKEELEYYERKYKALASLIPQPGKKPE